MDHGSILKTEVHDSKRTSRVGCRLSGGGRHYIQQLRFSVLWPMHSRNTFFSLFLSPFSSRLAPRSRSCYVAADPSFFLLPVYNSLQFAIFLLNDEVVSTVQPVYGIRYRLQRLRYIHLTRGRHYVPLSEFILPLEDTYEVSWDFLCNHNIHPGGRQEKKHNSEFLSVALTVVAEWQWYSHGPDNARGMMASVFCVEQF